MSLIGSLEDLGLGDILQIINLSRKSGVLFIRGSAGEGRIVFQGGMVRAANLKEGPEGLRELLVDQGFVSEGDYANALTHSKVQGVEMDAALCECASLTSERLESLRRELVEASVGRMFSWREGEFSFDVGGEEEFLDSDLALAIGVNAEYLAMESLRQSDEEARDGEVGGEADEESSNLNLDMSAEEMFGVVPEPDSPAPEAEHAQLELPGYDPNEDTHEHLAGEAIAETPQSSALDTLVEASAMSVSEGIEDVVDGDLLTAERHPEGELELAEIVDDDAPEEDGAPLIETPALILDEEIPMSTAMREVELAEAEFVDGGDFEESGSVSQVDVPVEEIRSDDATPVAVMGQLKSAEAEIPNTTSAADWSGDVEGAVCSTEDDSLPKNSTPVVVIDSDLLVLDWARAALARSFAKVHVFQRSQEGLGRIRQYLARAQMPLLLVSPQIEGNPLSGIVDAEDFVARLHKQAPRMSIAWLASAAAAAQLERSSSHPVAIRPSITLLGSDNQRVHLDALGAELRELLINEATGAASQHSEGPRSAPATAPQVPAATTESKSVPAEELEHLKEVTRALSEASSRGEVLPLVIRFAGETFECVAMFMVREDQVLGMAQVGLDVHGGPDDVEMRAISLHKDENPNVCQVIEEKIALRFAPSSRADQRLVSLLGGRVPEEVYLAPIVSGDQVVALLYGDAGMGSASTGGVAALEVVLHHAGLALDRAVLERALAEIEDESS